jgi:hypothetical protein
VTSRAWAVILLAVGVALMALGAWLGASHVHRDAGFVGVVDCGSAFSPTGAFDDTCHGAFDGRKAAAIGLLAFGAVVTVTGVAYGARARQPA